LEGLVLREVAPGVSVAGVQAATEPILLVPTPPTTITTLTGAGA